MPPMIHPRVCYPIPPQMCVDGYYLRFITNLVTERAVIRSPHR